MTSIADYAGLGDLLTEGLGYGGEPCSMVLLAGDASTRAYLRLGPLSTQSTPEATYILMAMGPSGGCEEEGSIFDPEGPLPFLEIQEVFQGIGVPVPVIHGLDRANGLMILEDLGDVTLADHLEADGLSATLPLYEEACRLLGTLQVKGGTPGGVIAMRDFNASLFRWEFDHYLEFALEAEFGPLNGADKGAVAAGLDALSAELGALPKVIVHRDYHSRNLMVHGGKVYLIDFQDALMGPGAYDLASLLWDAYVDLPEEARSHLVGCYLDGLKMAGGAVPEEAIFRRSLDLNIVHRSLKAAGRFAFFKHTRGNDAYMAAVPQALANAKAAAAGHPDLASLCEILAGYDKRLGL